MRIRLIKMRIWDSLFWLKTAEQRSSAFTRLNISESRYIFSAVGEGVHTKPITGPRAGGIELASELKLGNIVCDDSPFLSRFVLESEVGENLYPHELRGGESRDNPYRHRRISGR